MRIDTIVWFGIAAIGSTEDQWIVRKGNLESYMQEMIDFVDSYPMTHGLIATIARKESIVRTRIKQRVQITTKDRLRELLTAKNPAASGNNDVEDSTIPDSTDAKLEALATKQDAGTPADSAIESINSLEQSLKDSLT